MLPAQVSYWTLQETKRHNLATEELTSKQISETTRHNVATETLGWANLSELNRHNVATENISAQSLAETMRHNKVTEEQGWFNANTNREIGLANAESNRIQAQAATIQAGASVQQAQAAIMNAESNAKQASAALQNADTNYYNAQTSRRNQQVQAIQSAAQIDYWNAQAENMVNSLELGWFNANNNYQVSQWNTQLRAGELAVQQQDANTRTVKAVSDMWTNTFKVFIPFAE